MYLLNSKVLAIKVEDLGLLEYFIEAPFDLYFAYLKIELIFGFASLIHFEISSSTRLDHT